MFRREDDGDGGGPVARREYPGRGSEHEGRQGGGSRQRGSDGAWDRHQKYGSQPLPVKMVGVRRREGAEALLAKCAAENSRVRRLKRAAGRELAAVRPPPSKIRRKASEADGEAEGKTWARLTEPLLDGGEGDAGGGTSISEGVSHTAHPAMRKESLAPPDGVSHAARPAARRGSLAAPAGVSLVACLVSERGSLAAPA